MNGDLRYALITERLRAQGYTLSARHAANPKTQVNCFEIWIHAARGLIRIVMVFEDDSGYEVFKPVGPPESNDLQQMLDAI